MNGMISNWENIILNTVDGKESFILNELPRTFAISNCTDRDIKVQIITSYNTSDGTRKVMPSIDTFKPYEEILFNPSGLDEDDDDLDIRFGDFVPWELDDYYRNKNYCIAIEVLTEKSTIIISQPELEEDEGWG